MGQRRGNSLQDYKSQTRSDSGNSEGKIGAVFCLLWIKEDYLFLEEERSRHRPPGLTDTGLLPPQQRAKSAGEHVPGHR